MRIDHLLKGRKITLSCEVFPPKKFDGIAQVSAVAKEIAALRPSFMSVTYGASGSAPGHTLAVAQAVQDCGVTPLCHLTCVQSNRAHVEKVLSDMRDDGMENVLSSVKGFAKGRTVALFGCGGDRDKTKRPKMGRVAAEIADFAVVTTDNPRTEVPADIIADILPGFAGSDTPYVVVEDRIEAIHWAMDHAQPGDVIVLCGKGHETYQEVNHVKHHMDEREIVADYLNAGK